MAITIDISSILESADGKRYSAYRAGDAPVGGSLTHGSTVNTTVSAAGSRAVSVYEFTGGANGHIENAAIGDDSNFGSFKLGKGSYYGANSADIEVVNDAGRGKVWYSNVISAGPEYNGAIQYDFASAIGTSTKLKITYYVKNDAAGAGQWKMWRLRNQASQFPETATFDWFGQGDLFDYSPGNVDAGLSYWVAGAFPPATSWIKYSLEIDTGTVSGLDGKMRLYAFTAGGRVLVDSNINTYGEFPDALSIYTDTNRWDRFLLQNFSGNGLGDMNVYHDDLTIQVGTWASVEITDNAVYESSTVNEEQEVLSWVDNGATSDLAYRFNKGGLSAGTYYEHVRDDTGAVVRTRQVEVA